MTYNYNYDHPISSMMDNNFIHKYGRLSRGYDLIYPDGKPNLYVTYPLIVAFVFLFIGMFILFQTKVPKLDAYGNPVVDSKNTQIYVDPVELSPTQKIGRYISYLLFGIAIFFCLYYGYIYIFQYLYQYNNWYMTLPYEAQTELNMIQNASYFEDRMNKRNY